VAARVYEAFFSSNHGQQSEQYTPVKENDRIGPATQKMAREPAVYDRQQPEITGDDEGSENSPNGVFGHGYKLAAANPPGFWDYWSPRGCRNCHGYTPETLPPIGGHSPIPPSYSPRSGVSGGSGRSEPNRRNPKQCDLQHEADSQICSRQPSLEDIAICRASASRRLAHCLSTKGEVNYPPLDTARRLRPR
jgi:hypothetical protein